MYLPLPQVASGRFSYADAYSNAIAAHRRSPLSSASSIVILAAPDVDALCAARMLADLLRQDDVIFRIRPVSGLDELDRVRDELRLISELHSLFLINMGGVIDLPSSDWFGDFDPHVTVHIIDSARPLSLPSLFGAGENGNRFIVWDDGGAEKLEDVKKSWEALQASFEPDPDSDEDSDSESPNETEHDEEEASGDEGSDVGRKRKSSSDNESRRNKKRRLSSTDGIQVQSTQMSQDEREEHLQRLDKYYMSGAYYGQTASGTIYILATVLERTDNHLLWLAILALTYQYITSRISRERYELYHGLYIDEVSRLNTLPQDNSTHSLISLNPDDLSIRTSDELRFTLLRHWTLYDAMYHSSYVASKLGIWKERGRKRLTGLLAKMGFSIPQTQQPYAHMDIDLKRMLTNRLNDVAPEYGLVELSYPSFMRCYGYRTQPISAADAVEGISALLDVAGGVRMEIEFEGARNGGEWFGRGKVWEGDKQVPKMKKDENESQRPTDGIAEDSDPTQEEQWWIRNFWTAYDAVSNVDQLQEALKLSMSLHRAIIGEGTSIIDKQDIRTMKNHRVVVISQGPRLDLFSHPGVLSRLALWLVDALRDRVPGTNVSTRSKKESLPFVVACLNEKTQTYTIVGVMGALNVGEVRKNEFGLAFLDAKERCNARTRHGTFDTSVLEIDQADLKKFLETLCEGPDFVT